jgi:hypothetical protein
MNSKEIKKWKRTEEYYEMCNTYDLRSEDESDWPKIGIVLNDRHEFILHCNSIKDEAQAEYDNGDDTKMMDYMSAVDNAMVTEGVEEGSAGYYRMIIGSYEELLYMTN